MRLWIIYAVACATVVLGAICAARWHSPEAAIPLIAAGGYLLGWVREQPPFARPKEDE